MRVGKGKTIKYRISLYNPVMFWGSLEVTALFPEQVPNYLAEALMDKAEGDIVTCQLQYRQSFYDDSLIVKVPRQYLKSDIEIKPGMIFYTTVNGSGINGVIKTIDQKMVTIDCNYPLTGQPEAKCDISILAVRERTKNDLANLNQRAKIKVV